MLTAGSFRVKLPAEKYPREVTRVREVARGKLLAESYPKVFLSIAAWETKNTDFFSVTFALYFYHPLESYLKHFRSHFGTHLDVSDSK